MLSSFQGSFRLNCALHSCFLSFFLLDADSGVSFASRGPASLSRPDTHASTAVDEDIFRYCRSSGVHGWEALVLNSAREEPGSRPAELSTTPARTACTLEAADLAQPQETGSRADLTLRPRTSLFSHHTTSLTCRPHISLDLLTTPKHILSINLE